MCLSIPSKVIEIDENNVATVDTQFALESLEVYQKIADDMNAGEI